MNTLISPIKDFAAWQVFMREWKRRAWIRNRRAKSKLTFNSPKHKHAQDFRNAPGNYLKQSDFPEDYVDHHPWHRTQEHRNGRQARRIQVAGDRGVDKPMVLNSTNIQLMAKACGSGTRMTGSANRSSSTSMKTCRLAAAGWWPAHSQAQTSRSGSSDPFAPRPAAAGVGPGADVPDGLTSRVMHDRALRTYQPVSPTRREAGRRRFRCADHR